MELRWEDRQRSFQAKVLAESDLSAVDVRPYRTFLGASSGSAPPAGSRIERGLIVVIATVVIVVAMILIGFPKTLFALVAGLGGGAALVAGLAGPDPRARRELHEPLVAIFSATAQPGDPPECVTAITDAEQQRLGDEGFATVVGSARPNGNVGIFVDDYLVWARTPPRGPRRADPRFGRD